VGSGGLATTSAYDFRHAQDTRHRVPLLTAESRDLYAASSSPPPASAIVFGLFGGSRGYLFSVSAGYR
jgi:hypothetical protein